MTPSAIAAGITAIIDDLRDTPGKAIDPDCNFYQEAGLDSLQAVSLAVEIERKFSVRIPNEKLPELLTIRTLADFVSSRATLQRGDT